MASLYTNAIRQLRGEKSLKYIFKTLQNQTREIFRGDHNAIEESTSITTCLENLGQYILPEDDEYLEELESFILNGISNISRNYEDHRQTVTPTVLNFLMTAIRSYNHIRGTPYRVDLDRFQILSEMGIAFLTQVLIPYIDAGALHVFPTDAPLEFEIKQPKQVVKVRSPSPSTGNRIGSLSTAISFSKALRPHRRYRRTERRNRAKPGEHISNSDSGSSSDSDGGGRRGGGRKTNKRNRYSIRRRSKKN